MEMYYRFFLGMVFVLGTILILLDLLMQDVAETRGILSLVGIILVLIAGGILINLNNI